VLWAFVYLALRRTLDPLQWALHSCFLFASWFGPVAGPTMGSSTTEPRFHGGLTWALAVEVGGFEPPASSVRVRAGPVGALGVQGSIGSRVPIMSNTSAMVSDGLWLILLPVCFLIEACRAASPARATLPAKPRFPPSKVALRALVLGRAHQG